MALKFGTGGIPLTTKNKNVVEGIKRIKELGLEALEIEFVHQVFLNEKQAEEAGQTAKKLGIDLSIHGSYYINLASEDKAKWHASIQRILSAAKIGEIAGARFLTFHAGFRQGHDDKKVYTLVREGVARIVEEFEKKDYKIKLTPELTGKVSQWGDLEELIELVKDINSNKLGFCFDFAHKHARSGGKFNTRQEFKDMLMLIKKELGGDFLKDMHFHISGINYTDKGERNHLTLLGDYEKYKEAGFDLKAIKRDYKELAKKNKLGPADLNWEALLYELKEFDAGGIVVCESPNLEHDALLLMQNYRKLGKKL